MTESSITQISYSQFSENRLSKGGSQRTPVSGTLELTLRCNLTCAHCYCRLPLDDRQTRDKELSRTEVFALLDTAAAEGCLWLLITGGEPLVRPDFSEIYTYAKKKGFLITLFTNGTLVTDRVADFLKEYSPHKVEISLYGVTPEAHERVTLTPGSFQRTIKAVHRLLKRGIPFGLKTMAMTINHGEVKKLQKFANELGVEFRYDPIINAPFNGSMEALKLRLTPEEVLQLDLVDEKRSENYREFCQKFWGGSTVDNIFGCGAGLNNFHIDPYGQMSLCLSARWPSYDLRQGSFRDGFYTFFPQVRSQKPKSSYPCGHCELHSLCGNCPGTAYPEVGDPEAIVDYYCRIARLRAKAFGPNSSIEETVSMKAHNKLTE